MSPPRVLHVGCGHLDPKRPAPVDYVETRLDIDPQTEPDIVGSITDMNMIEGGSYDVVFSQHNLEHLEHHEVSLALREFRRVLCPTGHALIAVPDLQAVAAMVAEGQLDEPFGDSPSGPIAPIDVIYGLRSAIRDGRSPMTHRTGFVAASLARQIMAAGFAQAGVVRLKRTLEIWAEARMQPGKPDVISVLLAKDRAWQNQSAAIR